MSAPGLHHILDDAITWVWQASLAASVLFALVLLAQVAFKRVLSPRWRYLLGLLILVRLVLPAAPSSSISIFNLGRHLRQLSPPPAAQTQATMETQPAVSIQSLPDLPVAVAVSPTPKHAISPSIVIECVWLLGCLGMLVKVTWQHRRFALQLRRWREITEPRALVLLEECKAALGVKRRVRLLAATDLNTPAVFGLTRPCLIIPSERLQRLGDRELRHIILHELIHLQHGDLLVNWAMILLRAVHWFNPVVWLAFRRLRADQELACDAAVLSLLAGDERRAYGDTLIRLLDDFSAAGLCPGVVPFFTNKQVIKRRIIMIANFKPAGRIALLASAALMVALAGLTFTRAAGKPGISTDQTGQSPTPSADLQRAVADFQKVLADFDQRVRDMETKVNHLRVELGVVDNDPNSSGPGSSLGPINVMTLNQQQITAENEAAGEEKTQAELKKLSENPERLRNTLTRINPDPILSSLLQEYLTADNTIIALKTSVGPEHPDVIKAQALRDALDIKIRAQVEAIMKAMETRLAALKARSSHAQEKLQELKSMDLAAASAQRPYWEAKAELDRLKRLRDAIVLRAFQERVEAQLMPSVPPDALLSVSILSDGSIHLGGDNKPVSVEQLKAALKEASAKYAQIRLWIKADQHAPFDSMVKVMDAAKAANIRFITATTENQ